jgi:hypothetical protein
MFTVNETAFGWAEISAAAVAWGEWQPFVESVRQALACLDYAAATKQGLPSGELKEAVTAFRYAHNLISAEDAQAWLRRWELTTDEWMNCLRGSLLRERWSAKLKDIVAAHPVSDARLAAALRPHAICADQLGAWVVKLAGRAAVVAQAGEIGAGASSPHELIARIENSFAQAHQQAVTPQRLATKIADHRLDWIRFECRYIWFGEEHLAREAVLCVTEDGLTLDELADDARSVVQHWNFYLDEIETAARPLFLAARAGDWLGPVNLLEGFPLFSIAEKSLPEADDPHIRTRAEQALLRAWTEKAINERVKWMI